MQDNQNNPNEKHLSKGLKIFTISGILLLLLHSALITAYCFRDDLPFQINRFSDRYAVPMFHQNWKLFAPDLPKYNVELEYRYGESSGWSDWRDASASFGFGASSRMETIEQGFNTALGWQVLNNFYSRDGRKQFDRIVQSSDYARSLFFVLKMHELHSSTGQPDSVQVRLNFRFTPPPDQAYTFQTSYLEFPVFRPEK